MPDDFTLIRVSKPVVRRLNVAKSMKDKDQQVVADKYLTDAMDRDKIPSPDAVKSLSAKPDRTATKEVGR